MWFASTALTLAFAAPRIVGPTPPPRLDPLSPWGPSEQLLHSLVYDRIVHPSPDGWRSALVERLTQDGLQLTVQMQRGRRWHDGEPIAADDLCFTIQALLHPRSSSPLAPPTRARLADCTVHDDDPLAATLTLWTAAPAHEALAVPLLPAHLHDGTWVSGDPRPYAQVPVGCGPYRAEATTEGWRLTAVGEAPWRRLDWVAGATPQVGAMLLAEGAGVALPWVPPSARSALRNAEVGLFPWDRRIAWALALDSARPPLDDPRVREAIDLLLDRRVLRRLIAGDLTGPDPEWPMTSGPFAAGSPRENHAVPPTPRDPVRAAALLTEAGFSRGLDRTWRRDGEPLELRIAVPEGLGFAPEGVDLAWLGSGVVAEIVPIGRQAWASSVLAGGQTESTHAVLLPRALFPNDDPGAWVHGRTEREGWFNPYGVHDPVTDALVLQSRRPDGLQAARELHGRLAADRSLLFLFEERRWTAWRGPFRPWLPAPYDGWSRIEEWRLDD